MCSSIICLELEQGNIFYDNGNFDHLYLPASATNISFTNNRIYAAFSLKSHIRFKTPSSSRLSRESQVKITYAVVPFTDYIALSGRAWLYCI